jgi:SAM-dependent methyltransferase
MEEQIVMTGVKRLLRHWAMALLYPRPLAGLLYLPRYIRHWIGYRNRAGAGSMPMPLSAMQPCLGDWVAHTPFDAHYFYQGAWLARKVAADKPQRHVDIGSSVMTIGVLSGFVETEFVDFRPLQANLSGLHPRAGNILALSYADNALASLSCLHVIEHIGLGRYGDDIDPEGSRKAARELQRVLRGGGSLYLSLPVGRERVCFNAHRVHHPASVLQMFDGLQLADFSCVDDGGQLHEHVQPDFAAAFDYGCGLFHFRKAGSGRG